MRLLTLLLLLSFSYVTCAQEGPVRKPGRWYVGFQGGVTYTSSDVKTQYLNGWGAMFGVRVIDRPGFPLYLDLRMRYLGLKFAGHTEEKFNIVDPNIDAPNPYATFPTYNSLGYALPNHFTTNHALDFEVKLGLKNRKGLGVYLFGGIGPNWWNSKGNINSDTELAGYDFSAVENGDKISWADQNSIMDNTYETQLAGSENGTNVNWMPDFGLGIEWRPRRWFTIGLEHTTAFTMTDLYDGLSREADGGYSQTGDFYHLTSAFLKFHFGGGRVSGGGGHVTPIQTGVKPIAHATPCDEPVISYTYPLTGRTNQTHLPSAQVVARVTGVNSRNQITMKVNGVELPYFSYDPQTGNVEASVALQPGQNTIQVIGKNSCGQESQGVTLQYDIPRCDAPTISMVTPQNEHFNTDRDRLQFQAYVYHLSNSTQVDLKLNGRPVPFGFSNSGLVNANLELQPGLNTLILSAQNECGSTYKVFQLTRTPCEAPNLEVNSPATSPYTTTNSTFTVSGSLSGTNVSGITATLNGQNVTVQRNGDYFTFSASLNMGYNSITLRAENECGYDIEVISLVREDKPCLLPQVNISSPVATSVTTTNTSYNFTVQTTNVSSAGQLSVVMNGTSIPFNFNASNGTLTINRSLNLGSNVLVVSATNECGNAYDQVVVKREREDCDQPQIVFSSPAGNSTTTSNNIFTVSGVVNHVSSASQVHVTVNGQHFSAILANQGNAVTFTLPLQLTQNSTNQVQVTATNDCGQASHSVLVIQEPEPCETPTAVITAPSASPISTFDSYYTFLANVQNVDNMNDIHVTLNGNTAQFTYNPITGQVKSYSHLSLGTNTLVITVVTDCGKATAQAIVTMEQEECDIPEIAFSAPNTSSTTVNNTLYMVSGTVQHVNNAQGVQVTINGQSVNANISNQGGSVSFQIPVQFSATMDHAFVQVTANNECGQVSGAVTVDYEAPCQSPTVHISSPAPGMTTTASTFSLTASTSNVSANQAFVSLNGNNLPFNFANDGSITATGNLNVGTNLIVITVINECGKAQAQVEVTREAEACDPPVVNFTNPTTVSHVVNTNSFTVSGTVSNMSSTQGVQITLNGLSVSASTSVSGNVVSFNLPVQFSGNTTQNVVQVTATNDCGQASQNVLVNYEEPCVAPQVTIQAPGQTTTQGSAVFTGQVQNIQNSNQISATLNGANVPVIFNASSGSVSVNGNLAMGANTLVMTVANDCGQDHAQVTITRQQEPCDAPVVSFTSPSSATLLVSASSYTISGQVSNVDANTVVTVTLDGANYNSAVSTSGSTASFSIPVNLSNVANQHQVVVTAYNNCGQDSEDVVVMFDGEDEVADGQDGGHGNNGHGNNDDGVDSSNPGNGQGGPNGEDDPSGNEDDEGGNGNQGNDQGNSGNTGNDGQNGNDGQEGNGGNNGNGGHGNNGHGNNDDGVDSSNPGNGQGGPNGEDDASGNVDDEGTNGNQGNDQGNSGNTGNDGQNGNDGQQGNGGNNGNGGHGNNGHGNNDDGVDSSNPGNGQGGPNGEDDASGNVDDEGTNGNQGNDQGNSGNAGNQGSDTTDIETPADTTEQMGNGMGGGGQSIGGGNGRGGNNGHGNNDDGVDSSNPGNGQGGPNGEDDASGNVDDEGGRGGNQGGGHKSGDAGTDSGSPGDRDNAQERLQREQAAREQAAREQAAREQAAREQAAREQAAREQAAREQAAREQAAREQAAREQAAREQAAREQAAREQAAREQAAREQTAREQAAREQAAREQAAREQSAREQAAREQAAKEKAAREQAAREKAAREQAAKEQAAREQAAREKAAREKAAREQAAREQAAKEKAAREKAAREQAAKEAREKAAREAKEKSSPPPPPSGSRRIGG